MVNDSRSFARRLATFLADPVLCESLVRAQIAYALAQRWHLLRRPRWDDMRRHLPADMLESLRTTANVPFAIQMMIGRQLAAAMRAGTLDPIPATAVQATLGDLPDAQRGLERIKNTPLPRQYTQFPVLFTRLYCILLPIGLVNELGYATPIGSAVIGVMMLALDRIGQDLEDPFEDTVHDVAMAAISRSIEIDLMQAIAATDVPGPAEPVHGVLW